MADRRPNILYDIRQQMPQFPANHFPPYVYVEYPKMMTHKVELRGALINVPYYHPNSKREVIVQNREEEDAFWAKIEGSKPVEVKPSVVAIPVAAPIAAVAPPRMPFEAVPASEADKPVAKAKGWPKGKPRKPKNLSA